jgi:hypothetical protein
MPRITISIPAGLKQRLQDPKVRNSVNISRICQKALHREVQRILDLPLDLQKMEGILSRLHQEREKAGERWFSSGASAAREWVEHEAPYALLRQLGEASPGERVRMLRESPPPTLTKRQKNLEKEKDFSPGSYLEGFSRTVGLLWEVIDRNL